MKAKYEKKNGKNKNYRMKRQQKTNKLHYTRLRKKVK